MMYRRKRLRPEANLSPKKLLGSNGTPGSFTETEQAVRECLVVSQRMALKFYIEKKIKKKRKEMSWRGKGMIFIQWLKTIKVSRRQTDVCCTEEDSINVLKIRRQEFFFFFYTLKWISSDCSEKSERFETWGVLWKYNISKSKYFYKR